MEFSHARRPLPVQAQSFANYTASLRSRSSRPNRSDRRNLSQTIPTSSAAESVPRDLLTNPIDEEPQIDYPPVESLQSPVPITVKKPSAHKRELSPFHLPRWQVKGPSYPESTLRTPTPSPACEPRSTGRNGRRSNREDRSPPHIAGEKGPRIRAAIEAFRRGECTAPDLKTFLTTAEDTKSNTASSITTANVLKPLSDIGSRSRIPKPSLTAGPSSPVGPTSRRYMTCQSPLEELMSRLRQSTSPSKVRPDPPSSPVEQTGLLPPPSFLLAESARAASSCAGEISFYEEESGSEDLESMKSNRGSTSSAECDMRQGLYNHSIQSSSSVFSELLPYPLRLVKSSSSITGRVTAVGTAYYAAHGTRSTERILYDAETSSLCLASDEECSPSPCTTRKQKGRPTTIRMPYPNQHWMDSEATAAIDESYDSHSRASSPITVIHDSPDLHDISEPKTHTKRVPPTNRPLPVRKESVQITPPSQSIPPPSFPKTPPPKPAHQRPRQQPPPPAWKPLPALPAVPRKKTVAPIARTSSQESLLARDKVTKRWREEAMRAVVLGLRRDEDKKRKIEEEAQALRESSGKQSVGSSTKSSLGGWGKSVKELVVRKMKSRETLRQVSYTEEEALERQKSLEEAVSSLFNWKKTRAEKGEDVL